MNRTVAVLLKMNLSQAQLSRGIRLAVQEANSAKRQANSEHSTPQSLTRRDSEISCISCSSESNLSGNYSNLSDTELSSDNRSGNKPRRRNKKRKPRSKNVDTPAAKLAKKICAEFLLARHVWTALYDNNGRMSDYRLDVVLEQVSPNLLKTDQRLLHEQRPAVVHRIKRVLALGKNYRNKKAALGSEIPDAPMGHIIDLSGESSAVEEIDRQVASAMSKSAPGRAAIARRKLFDRKAKKSAAKPEEDKPEEDKPANPKAVDKAKLAREFKERLDKARKRPAPLEKAKSRNSKRSKSVSKRQKNGRKTVAKRSNRNAARSSATDENEKHGSSTDAGRGARRSTRKAARSATAKITSCSEEEARGESEEDDDNGAVSPPEFVRASFVVGAKVTGKWKGPRYKGEWFPGTIVSINDAKRTAHIKYDDGDVDENLAWKNLYLEVEE